MSSPLGCSTKVTASEFVRTSWPSCAETRGSVRGRSRLRYKQAQRATTAGRQHDAARRDGLQRPGRLPHRPAWTDSRRSAAARCVSALRSAMHLPPRCSRGAGNCRRGCFRAAGASRSGIPPQNVQPVRSGPAPAEERIGRGHAGLAKYTALALPRKSGPRPSLGGLAQVIVLQGLARGFDRDAEHAPRRGQMRRELGLQSPTRSRRGADPRRTTPWARASQPPTRGAAAHAHAANDAERGGTDAGRSSPQSQRGHPHQLQRAALCLPDLVRSNPPPLVRNNDPAIPFKRGAAPTPSRRSPSQR